MNAAGIAFTAGAIAIANDAIFVPIETHKPPGASINWRIVPATAVAILTLSGLEKVSEPLGKGLASLGLLAVLLTPMGKGGSPLENAAKALGYAKKIA